MDTDEFWEIIRRARAFDDPEHGLQAELTQRSTEEIRLFDREMDLALNAAYSWALWGVGYIAEGGMSDDAFEYFRTWLIMQGREAFEKVVADPDSLSELPVPESGGYEFEGPQYVASILYADRTGGKWPTHDDIHLPELGDGWDFDDPKEMTARYPRMIALVNSRW